MERADSGAMADGSVRPTAGPPTVCTDGRYSGSVPSLRISRYFE